MIGVNSFAPSASRSRSILSHLRTVSPRYLRARASNRCSGPADIYYRKGLTQYYAGHYGDAINNFDQTLAMSPNYPGLADLRTSAANLRQQYGDGSAFRSPIALWYLVGGAFSFSSPGAG